LRLTVDFADVMFIVLFCYFVTKKVLKYNQTQLTHYIVYSIYNVH